jgi:hypothetical protein
VDSEPGMDNTNNETQSEDTMSTRDGCNWDKVFDKLPSDSKVKLNSFLDNMWNNNAKLIKKKCISKFNLAKKKYSKKCVPDKKIDQDQESVLVKDEHTYSIPPFVSI